MPDEALPEHKRGTSKPTIQDIARRAGVGVGTVSRVLNDHPNVSPATRQQVLRAIDELGYRPRFAARHLRTQRSRLIGFITDEIATTPFAGDIIRGAQEAAWAQGMILLVVNTGNDMAMAETAIEMMLEREVEGIIYAAMYHRAAELPDNIYQITAVLADCFCADRSLPSVVPDEVGGGRTATEALLRAGHRRIGFINLRPGIPASEGRLQGYRHALASYGLSYDPTLVRYGFAHSDAESGYRHTLELMHLPDPPTALFCGNDRTAMGAYNALRELALRIPDDVAVVGFDNQEVIATALRPPLTTVQLPHYEMGQWAANYLIEHIAHHKPVEPVQHKIACTLVERESV